MKPGVWPWDVTVSAADGNPVIDVLRPLKSPQAGPSGPHGPVRELSQPLYD
jgi:hypothetical protein